MLVRDWMTSDVRTVTPGTAVHEIRTLLGQGGFRHVPVVDGGRLVGVVSDRDVRGERGRTAGTVMSTSVHTVSADDTVEAAARLMLSRRVSSLPVLDDENLVGIITTTDCLLALLSRDE